MPIVYRGSGAWGAGLGRNLTAADFDGNTWTIVQMIAGLSDGHANQGVGISNITQSGQTLTIYLTDGTTRGPFTLPSVAMAGRGLWTPSTAYAVNDVISYGPSAYLVLVAHTSASTFNPAANDGLGHNYYSLLLTVASSIPTGGSTGYALVKASSADFDSLWAPIGELPVGGSAGEVLIKLSGTNFDADWVAAAVPPGGAEGQVLRHTGSGDYAFGWSDETVPAGGTLGQVLAKSSDDDYALGWVTPTTPTTTLAGDTDVALTSPANKDVLTYDSVAAKWKNKPAAGTWVHIATITLSGVAAPTATVANVFSDDYLEYSIQFIDMTSATNGDAFQMKINGGSGGTGYVNATGGVTTAIDLTPAGNVVQNTGNGGLSMGLGIYGNTTGATSAIIATGFGVYYPSGGGVGEASCNCIVNPYSGDDDVVFSTVSGTNFQGGYIKIYGIL